MSYVEIGDYIVTAHFQLSLNSSGCMVPLVQASALRATWQSHLLYNLIISWNPATQHGEFDFNPASSKLKLKSQHSVARLGAKENKCNRKTCSRMKDSSQFIQPTLDPEPKALQGHERS